MSSSYGFSSQLPPRPAQLGVYHAYEQLRRVAFSPSLLDLVAVGGLTSVQVLRIVPTQSEQEVTGWELLPLASWRLAEDVTALDWSPRSQSDYFEIAVATSSSAVRLLSWTEEGGARIRALDGSLGNWGRVHEVRFCRTEGQERLLASVADDGQCLLWDLSAGEGAVVTAIPHPQPLRSISFNPDISSQLLTTDAKGSSRIIDWRRTQAVLATLGEPRSMAGRSLGSSSGEWNPCDGNLVGAIVNGRWAVFDLRQINGGRALRCGEAFGEESRGREVFRWNPANPRQFAVLSSDPKASPAVKIFSTASPQAPRSLAIAPRPLQAQDLAWHPTENVLAVVVGRDVSFHIID